MSRRSAPAFFRTLLAVALVAGAAHAASLTPQQKAASTRYVLGLRNKDGGFRAAAAAGPSSLGATNSGLRALHYLGNKLEDPRDVPSIGFLLGCWDRQSGGFADAPGGPVSVRSTAMGVMASAEFARDLGDGGEVLPAEVLKGVHTYFGQNAKSLDEIYIAAASLHAAGVKSPDASKWADAFQATARPDGTYGATPVDTARAVVTLLRLGAQPKDQAAAMKSLHAAQRPDGGWGVEKSDLPGTYSVMRAFYMTKEKPNLKAVRELVGRCRNPDGGYGVTPGTPSALSPTYFASIVLHWADEMEK
ncbi:MAG: prenyltransferase/squalene oxidase repeat-containing protein [Armatimonadota bacterium]